MSSRLPVVLCVIGLVVVLLVAFAILFGPQALMVYSMRKMAAGSPELSMVPQELLLTPLDSSAGRRVAYFGYEFALPWSDMEEQDLSEDSVDLGSDSGDACCSTTRRSRWEFWGTYPSTTLKARPRCTLCWGRKDTTCMVTCSVPLQTNSPSSCPDSKA